MFILRALNHSRHDFLPTYLGMRMLLSQIDRESANGYLSALVRRNALGAQTQGYKRHLLYKSTSPSGELIYRNASAASPSTLLLESYCLELLSKEPSFRNPDSTFSYLWSKPKSSSMWQYFFDGWQRREGQISRAFDAHDDVLVLVDVQNFYGSAKSKSCLESLRKKLNTSSLTKMDQKIIEFAAEQALIEGGNSIPVGPPLGHALANVFLSDVDFKLNELFPNKYFRYVDDIAIIVKRREVKSSIERIRDVLQSYGLSLNKSKTNVVERYEWEASRPPRDETYDFGVLRSMLATHLVLKPGKRDEVERRFLDGGFNIPFIEVARMSQGRGFAYFLKNLWSRSLTVYRHHERLSTEELLVYAKKLRVELEDRIYREGLSDLSDLPFANARRLRRNRNDIFKLAYMLPISKVPELQRFIPVKDNSTADLRCLLEACGSGDVTELLSYPGPPIRTFGQLWSGASKKKAMVRRSGGVRHQERDSAATLLIWQVIDDLETKGDIRSDALDSKLFEFCSGNVANSRELDDFSYLDEIRSLQLGSSREIIPKLLHSRFDEAEDSVIEGLAISASYS